MADLRERVETHLRATRGDASRVKAVTPLSGGACQENFRVELEGAAPLVLRSDASTSLSGSISREQEFRTIGAAHARGVKTPAAQWLGRGIVKENAWAYFLDWVDGETIGRKVLKNPELAAARTALAAALANELAKIHAVRPQDAAGDGAPLHDARIWPRPRGSAAQARLAGLKSSIDRLREPRPAQELVLAWLVANAPGDEDIVLGHGDFRTGNFMVAPAGLVALLDWEFSHFGSRYEDLTWISVRDWRFGALDKPIGGFAKRAPFYEAYEKAAGVTLDPKQLFYWEVLGNLQWAIGCVEQGERYMYGGVDEFELVAIGRRAAEMEFEAFRLLDRGHF